MIGAPESREGASSMRLTFQNEEAEQIAGTLTNEGKTGSEHLNGPAHGENSLVLTAAQQTNSLHSVVKQVERASVPLLMTRVSKYLPTISIFLGMLSCKFPTYSLRSAIYAKYHGKSPSFLWHEFSLYHAWWLTKWQRRRLLPPGRFPTGRRFQNPGPIHFEGGV